MIPMVFHGLIKWGAILAVIVIGGFKMYEQARLAKAAWQKRRKEEERNRPRVINAQIIEEKSR